MHATVIAAIGIASGVVNASGLIPYIRDIFRHKTKPERATWWVWFSLAGLAFYAQYQAGATWSLILTAVNIIGCGTIATLSLRYGFGRFHRRDIASLVVAALGIVISQYIKSPLFALLIIIAVDIAGLWLTLYKSWLAPYTETLTAWLFATVAAALAVGSVGGWNITKIIYPLYIFLGNGILVTIIIRRRSVVDRQNQK